MIIYVTTAPGLEDVCAKEVENLGGKVVEVREGRGRVFLKGDLKIAVKLNYLSRTVERVMVLLRFERFERLEDIYRTVKEIDFSFIKPYQSFAVRPSRVGEHDFTSLDVGRVAGQAVIDSYMESKGVRLKVNLDEPDVIIRVDVINDEVYVGLDTTGDKALHRRGYRVYDHPAPLNPVIASALVMISGWKCDGILIDPMCGSGTVLIESAMMCRNIPPQKLRNDFQFVKIWGREILEEVKREVVERDVDVDLVGVERFRKHLRGAKMNSSVAGVVDTIDYVQGDATRLPLKRGDVIVTNPPYGLRIAKKGIIEELYEGFLRSAKGVVKRVVVITAEHRIMKEKAMKLGYKIVEERFVKYGGLSAKVFVFE